MCFSCIVCKSLIAVLFTFTATSFVSVFAQPAMAVNWQDEVKANQADQTNVQDSQKADDAKNNAGDQDGSSLVDSPLESAQPVVPKQVVPPWAKEEKRSNLPDLKDLTPRDLLVDIDQGELEHLYDYEAIEPDDLTLIKILYRLHRFSLEEVWRFVQQTKTTVPSAIAKDPQANRLKMFRLQGRATKVERHDLIDRVAELYELVDVDGNPHSFSSYYRVHAVLEPDNQLATICVINVPESWKSPAKIAVEIDEPFASSAMFLKINSREEEPADLLFAADRIEWYPVSNALDANLSAGELMLAKHGFDVSLLAGARARNRKSIDAADTPCFYQMLGTVSKMSAEDFSGASVPELDLLELMNHAAKNHGHFFNLQADIRNVTEVKIDQDFYRQELGMDHYYQLDGFINTDVEIVDPELKKKGAPSYGKRFPISVCVPSLPAGMKVDSKRIYQVTMPVFFFKIWPYKSQWTRQVDENLEQTAPLLIGVQPNIESQTASSPFTTVLMAVVCLFLFGFIWIGFWKLTKKSRPSQRTKFQIGGPESGPQEKTTDSSADSSPIKLPKIDR